MREVLNQFLKYAKRNKSYPRELYQSILYVSEELIVQSKLEDAASYLKTAMEIGINKFPDLRVDAINKLSSIYNRKGFVKESSKELAKLAGHPYLLTDRNQVPEVLYNLSRNSLNSGNIKKYKKFLFVGLKYFYTNPGERKRIFNQLRLTYRNSFLLIIKRDVPFSSKFIFFLHWIHYIVPNFGKIKLSFVNSVSRKIFLSVIYLYNYFIRSANPLLAVTDNVKDYSALLNYDNYTTKSIRKSNTFLITRAMGGIGDLLMMTPGIHALKRKYPRKEIHLAIPKRYFPISIK